MCVLISLQLTSYDCYVPVDLLIIFLSVPTGRLYLAACKRVIGRLEQISPFPAYSDSGDIGASNLNVDTLGFGSDNDVPTAATARVLSSPTPLPPLATCVPSPNLPLTTANSESMLAPQYLQSQSSAVLPTAMTLQDMETDEHWDGNDDSAVSGFHLRRTNNQNEDCAAGPNRAPLPIAVGVGEEVR